MLRERAEREGVRGRERETLTCNIGMRVTVRSPATEITLMEQILASQVWLDMEPSLITIVCSASR